MNDVIDFSKDDANSAPDAVRRESWPVKGPAELEVGIDVGRITVRLDSEPCPEVTVEVRHDPTVGGGWAQGLTGLVTWLGNAAGAPQGDPAQLAADAVAAAEISWSEPARRLVVRSSQELSLRVVPLEVTITAPQGSRIAARTGAGDVTVAGTAGWAAVRTGAGSATLEAVDGDADVTTGSGDVGVGPVSGRARVRTGSGAIRLADLGGATDIRAGSGDVDLGVVSSDLGARTGSGSLRIADARSGRYELTTGSGDLRVGVHPGVTAEVDLSSGSGSARSDLEVAGSAPAGGAVVHVRGRTGSGDVVVTRAVPV
jgi:hypothetical protein